MGVAGSLNQKAYEDIMAKIMALCKGFLLIPDKSTDRATSFCRGALILFNQVLHPANEINRS